jgi:signal recognition particle subunit SRP54
MLSKIPGMDKQLRDADIDDRIVDRMEAIILSMTPQERAKPDLLNASRKRRIAAGSGMRVEDVNRLLKQYEQMLKMVKQLKNNKRFRGGGMGGFGGLKGLGL